MPAALRSFLENEKLDEEASARQPRDSMLPEEHALSPILSQSESEKIQGKEVESDLALTAMPGHDRSSELPSVASTDSWATETPSELWDSDTVTTLGPSTRECSQDCGALGFIMEGTLQGTGREETVNAAPMVLVPQESDEPLTPTEAIVRPTPNATKTPEKRGRTTTADHDSPGESIKSSRLQTTRRSIQRTISSPPSLKRSRSTPRPPHILAAPSRPPAPAPNLTQASIAAEGVSDRYPRPSPNRQAHLAAPQDSSYAAPPKAPRNGSEDHSEPNGASPSQHPIQTYLQLALASPPPAASDTALLDPAPPLETKYPYTPSDHPDLVLERITNFVYLPPYLESVLWFGILACLDSWLYTFTILPLRFFQALGLLIAYWWSVLTTFWDGGRRLQKKRQASTISGTTTPPAGQAKQKRSRRMEREKKISGLLPQHKADLLKGAVVVVSCFVLTRFDASRMYHSIRGQAAIKLYVLYNVLEVADRLLSALGQDIFECLFSKDTLERKPDGRSKVGRPFWCFLLATAYNVLHSMCLFYQLVTLNVAVNSYSNALLTLLVSSQFVEIKSTVFKRFEKQNLFQITCADVVERFQLWLMLMVIVCRNLVELGVRSSSDYFSSLGSLPTDGGINATAHSSGGAVLPRSFTIFPKWTGQVMGPFLLVLGSETLVDWLKHAYITKFNQIRPKVYERFLDVLCKDYYSNAFSEQNLTKRFGLPVIPLASLFIRASLQTYHMFISTHVSVSTSLPTTTYLSSTEDISSPATTAALTKFDAVLRRALGRSSFGAGTFSEESDSGTAEALMDDLIAATTLVLFLLGVFLLFLALKLVLGILLLSFSRKRYKRMKEREKEDILTGGRRTGGFGLIEVDNQKRRHIYGDDPAGEKRVRDWEVKAREREVESATGIGKGGVKLDDVTRYSMVGKTIW